MRRFLPVNYVEFVWTTTDVNQEVRIPLNSTIAINNPTLYVEWGDGTSNLMTDADVGSQTHIYAAAGTYQSRVYGDVRSFSFNSLPLFAARLIETRGYFANLLPDQPYRSCSNLSDIANLGNSQNVTSLFNYVRNCASLTSFDTFGWDTRNVDTFREFARQCASLTTFDISHLSFVAATTCRDMFRDCSALTTLVVGDAFDDTPCLAFNDAFRGCALNESSVDAILISINNANTSNGTLGINGGTNATPSVTGQAATDALRARGWTVNLNGY